MAVKLMRRQLAALACLAVFPLAAAQACTLPRTEIVRVETVSSATEYVLADGRTLRLEAAGPPRAPSRHGGDWTPGVIARDRVAARLEGAPLNIAALPETDRYGRIIAQAWLEDGVWLNGALVSAGDARVETLPGETRCAGELLALEREARDAARGMWQLTAYQVLGPTESAAFTNDFRLVEGVIFETAEVRGRIYLNFGEDWRTDFTVTIAARDARAFSQAGLDPLSWTGQRIRVRGWLSWYNGPQIEVDHPEQIELLPHDATEQGDEQ